MARLCVVAMLIGCSRSPSTTTDGPPFSLPSDTFAGPDAGAPSITPGAPDRFLLTGMIVTPDNAFAGQVLVEQAKITCVDVSCAAMPGAAGATLIDTQGIIAPGTIDTHNHILFDIFDNSDWFPAQLYQDHDQWTTEPKYGAMLDVKQCLVDDSQGKPDWCAMTAY